MIGLMMPEVVLYDLLNGVIKLLRTDLESHLGVDEEKSLLYRIMGLNEQGNPLRLSHYHFFKQARKILTTKDNLKVYYGYNLSTTTGVDICILLPSENGKTAIGADEGYLETIEGEEGSEARQLYNVQTFESNYQLMITSNNSLEVLTVYTLLKSVMLMLIDQFELYGFRNPKFSGQDIVMQEDLAPVPLFHKVLNVEFLYEHVVPQALQNELLKQLNFTSDMINEEGESLAELAQEGNGVRAEPGTYVSDETWVDILTRVRAYPQDYTPDYIYHEMKEILALKKLV